MQSSQQPISLATRVRRADHVLARNVDDETLLLDLNTQQYFGLGGVGTRLWDLLAETHQLRQAHAQLLEEFEVAPEVLEADLIRMLGGLRERGLVEIDDA